MKLLCFALLLLAGSACAQEEKFIAVLKSGAPLPEKADACQELARVATRDSVPVLAALLADPQLAVRARTALESIADPSVDVALRESLGRLQGSFLAGAIQSLGVRQDPQAVEPLARFLAASDPVVAPTAARALGRLGAPGLPALEGALSSGSPALVPAVCEGLFRCAESLPAAAAAAVYDKVRALPDLPLHLRVAALSGAIRSRGPSGVSLLMDAIRSGSPVPASDAVRISMDLPGSEVTRALVEAVALVPEETQVLLLESLGHRGDVAAAPALIAWARRGPVATRCAALRSLVPLRQPSLLTSVAASVKDPDPRVAEAAMMGLAGWPGREADDAVLWMLADADAKTRIAAMGAVGLRRISGAIPSLLKAAADSEPAEAGASFKVLGELGGAAEIPGVVSALSTTRALAAGENALIAICERQSDPAGSAEKLLPGLAAAKGEVKLTLLNALGSVAGPRALEALRAATTDADESVRETAWRLLCDWPSADALPDLARITGTTTDPALRSLALRGQLRLIPLGTGTPAEKAAQVQALLPLAEQCQAQPLVLSTLGGLHCPESLALVLPYLGRSAGAAEAGLAAVGIAEAIVAGHPALVAEAMSWVRSQDAPLVERVRRVLARVPAAEAEAGFVSLVNGNDLDGWDGKPGWWKVVEGVLTAESTPDKPCDQPNYLVWRGGQPSDFELIADFRLSGAGNSGIQLRSRALPNWDTSGYQADMSGDGALVGFVYEHARGLIAGRGERVRIGADGQRTVEKLGDPAALAAAYRREGWNTYRILCQGPTITLFINGTLQCQFTDEDPKHAASKGVIALQMHPGPPMKVEFRNLRMRSR